MNSKNPAMLAAWILLPALAIGRAGAQEECNSRYDKGTDPRIDLASEALVHLGQIGAREVVENSCMEQPCHSNEFLLVTRFDRQGRVAEVEHDGALTVYTYEKGRMYPVHQRVEKIISNRRYKRGEVLSDFPTDISPEGFPAHQSGEWSSSGATIEWRDPHSGEKKLFRNGRLVSATQKSWGLDWVVKGVLESIECDVRLDQDGTQHVATFVSAPGVSRALRAAWKVNSQGERVWERTYYPDKQKDNEERWNVVASDSKGSWTRKVRVNQHGMKWWWERKITYWD